jgi:hypothetical protein
LKTHRVIDPLPVLDVVLDLADLEKELDAPSVTLGDGEVEGGAAVVVALGRDSPICKNYS